MSAEPAEGALRQALEEAVRPIGESMSDLLRGMEEMARHLLDAEDMLRRYGRHRPGCSGRPPGRPCRCGWAAARRRILERAPERTKGR